MTSAPSGRALMGRMVVALIPVAAIALAFLPLTPAYDVDVFLRAGTAAAHGLQVYPTVGTPAVYSGFSFVYPYFALWPFVLLAELPAALGTAVVFWISALAVIAACMLAPVRGPWRAVLVLCTAFTITGLQLGALSPLLFAGVVFLWRARGRAGLFVLAGPVIACKLFLAPMLVWLLLAGRYRALAWAGASTVALLSVGFLLGPVDPSQYLNMLSQLGAHEARSGFGLIGALMNAGVAMFVAQALALALSLVILVAVHQRYRRTRDERLLFCAGLVASLLLTPVLWSHYLVVLAAALLAYDARRRWFVLFALASWAISPPHGLPDSALIQIGALAATAVAVLFIARSSTRARYLRAAPGMGSPALGVRDSTA
ncbi:MAG: glycosyltransferase family 87 protein [Solirubrobacteraceae bacterium]